MAGRRARGQTVRAFGLIDAQPLAHGGVADADALRRGLAADLACFDFFHKGDLLLWRQLWSLGHGEHLKRVRSEEIGVKGVKTYRGVGAGFISPGHVSFDADFSFCSVGRGLDPSAELPKNACRGEHCSPVPVCLARKPSRKMRCGGKWAGDQWSPLHTQ